MPHMTGCFSARQAVTCPHCGWRTHRVAVLPSDPSHTGREFGFGVCKMCPDVSLKRAEPRVPGRSKLAQGAGF